MATVASYSPKPFASYRPTQTVGAPTPSTATHLPPLPISRRRQTLKPIIHDILHNHGTVAALVGTGLALTVGGAASAAEFPLLGSSLQLNEPANALSLPTWAVHVSSVIEWVTAMALVWQYGEKSGYESWKGLSWGMVLVAIQAALTVIGNLTMCIAAFRIYRSFQKGPENL
ncbi:PREDICTED: uncharacterized protein LOC104611867 isoform X2 [Nelumbo nucifera]|uniref:Uncharacterized protein LOC104611867 isoform X2 n=2 Tax=Nelumbo nucifera TaxID=4432 RepID=A0A1U8B8K4_NELNU|nr:PREDICTED: uncharacterized protein LOC104611867 isoform X2 [Nelumbo nucifera]DAD18650.1 TPA_asm: hypothetical protein HUJ06_020113 [Nelumbo nucifera]